MQVCIRCDARFVSSEWLCPQCHFVPVKEGKHRSFVQKNSGTDDGFNANTFSALTEIENIHFWFKARNDLIVDTIRTHFPGIQNFLEIGCGTGAVLNGIHHAFPAIALSGSEITFEGLGYAANKVSNATLYQMDARVIPFEEEFDTVGAFDVIEHIQEDELVLRQMHRACKRGGGIILTVPQHPFLWSATDEYACHKRRYIRRELVAKVERAGFKVEHVSSFVFFLFPLMIISRLIQSIYPDRDDAIDEGFYVSRPVNRLFSSVMALERFLIKKGISFPMGGSLLLAARKK